MEDKIFAACTERISTLWDEISILEEKSEILNIENPRISEKIIRREREITELEEIMEKISLQQKQKKRAIAFVDTVDKAHEYFDLKDYLRAECGSDKYNFWQDDIEDILVKVSKDTNMFNRVSEEHIAYAVDDHVVNVRTIHKFEHVHRLCETEYRKVKGITSELTIEDYKEMARMFPHLCLHKRYENEDPDTNPVYSVVCQSRDKNYVMDENPEVELLKIEESIEEFDESWIFCDEEEENTDSYIYSDEEEEENTDSYIYSDEEEEENTDSCICSDEVDDDEEEKDNIDSCTSRDEEEEKTENDAPEKVEDIASRFIEALDKYSKLRNRGKKTVKNVKDDSSADRLDNYSKLKNLGEENLDKNMRNQGEDSDRYDCGADWVTVSVP